MFHRFKSLLLLGLALTLVVPWIPPNVPAAKAAVTWQRVNTTNFADGGTSYSAPTVFNGNIYVAVAKTASGTSYTEIWRSLTGANNTWSKVVANGLTHNLGSTNNTGEVMQLFVGPDNNLYLTNDPNKNVASCDPTSCQMIWRSSDGINWTPTAPNNFQGVSQSTQKKSGKTLATDWRSGGIVSFQNKFYVATAKHVLFSPNATDPPDCGQAELFRSANGSNWEAAWNSTGPNSGIGDSPTCLISGLLIYKSKLVISTIRWDGSGGKYSQLFSSDDGLNWTAMLTTPAFRDQAVITGLATLSSSYGDELFAAAMFTNGSPPAVYTSINGSDWGEKTTTTQNISGNGNTRITAIQSFGNQVLVGTDNASQGTQVWQTPAGGPVWTQLNPGNNGFGTAQNSQTSGFLIYGNYIYAQTANASGVQLWRTTVVDPLPIQCTLDIAIVLDVSGSMNQSFIGTSLPKLGLAKSVINGSAGPPPETGLLDLIASPHNGSRVALLTFDSNLSTHAVRLVSKFSNLDGASPGVDFFDPNQSDFKTRMKNIVSNTTAEGDTTMAHAVGRVDQMFQTGRPSPQRAPLVIFVSDGSPTVDLASTGPIHVFPNAETDAISLFQSGTTQFRSQADVQQDGPLHSFINPPSPEHSGKALSDVMGNTDQLFRDVAGLQAFSVAMYANPPNGNFNLSTLNYIGFKGGGAAPGFRTYSPQNETDLFTAFQNLIQFEACQARFIVDFPPKVAYQPKTVYFGGATYSITYPNSSTVGISCSGSTCGSYTATAEIVLDHDNANTYWNHVRLTIKGFRRRFGPDSSPPWTTGNIYGFKVLFNEPISSAVLGTIDSNLISQGQQSRVFIGNSACSANVSESYLCFSTQILVDVPDITNEQPQTLLQKVQREKLFIEGNVAAPGSLSNFSVASNAIVVGGTIGANVIGGSADLSSYLPSQHLSWANVAGQITDLFNRRKVGTQLNSAFLNYGGPVWYLNSVSNSPATAATSTFSTPPEGKLWYTPDASGSLTLSGPVRFSGSGTIAVNGNLTLTSSADLTCAPGTRLAFIVNGSITINSNIINCGAFAAINGNIIFNMPPEHNGSIKGIFISSGSVRLPDPAQLSGGYRISYDSDFAAEPTVLLQELLKLVFSTSG